jgi:hypothetical protein
VAADSPVIASIFDADLCYRRRIFDNGAGALQLDKTGMAARNNNAGNSLAEMRKRIELNELRARELESQARVMEARIHFLDVQKKFRERLPAAKPPTPK